MSSRAVQNLALAAGLEAAQREMAAAIAAGQGAAEAFSRITDGRRAGGVGDDAGH